MNDEVKHLARHISELEDREIEVMEALEPLDRSSQAGDVTRERPRRRRRAAAGGHRQRPRRRSTTRSPTETRARAAAASGVRDDLLARYEQLRSKLGGTGAARLVGGSCSGCHLALVLDGARPRPQGSSRRRHHLRAVRPDPGALTPPCSSSCATARPTGNAAGQLLGRSESPLTAKGRSDVVALRGGARAREPARVQPPGPGSRHRRGAGVGPARRGRRAVDRGGLRRARGASARDVPAEVWARWRADPSFRPPGRRVARRGRRPGPARLRRAVRRDPARGHEPTADVVVVSHVSPIKAAVAWALGAGDEVVWRLYLATASITRIGWGNEGPVLHRYNETVSRRRRR